MSLDQGGARHLRRVLPGELDLVMVQSWIGDLLQERGEDIFRMKGVLAIAHASRRFVFHAVHMTMDGRFAEPWEEGEARESKLVFIGKSLDAKELAAGFNDCLATPELRRLKLEALRFGVGDAVECKTAPGVWSAGKVVALMYRDDEMPPGLVAPYQIRLDEEEAGEEGCLIWAREDSDHLVRSSRRRSKRLKGSGRGADDDLADEAHAHEHEHDQGSLEDGHVHDSSCEHDDDEGDDGAAHSHSHAEGTGRRRSLRKPQL